MPDNNNRKSRMKRAWEGRADMTRLSDADKHKLKIKRADKGVGQKDLQ